MDAVKFLKKYHKLCDPRSCDDCPLLKRVDGFKTCLAGERNGYEERVVEIVEKWSKEQENKMTKAEALELLRGDAFKVCAVDLCDNSCEDCYEALYMAIEALEQEPTAEYSSDVISRQAAIEAVHSYFKDKLDGWPTEETEEGYEVYCDMDKIDALLSDNKYLTKRIDAIPSADRPKGHWVDDDEQQILMKKFIEKGENWKVCNICGAGMRVGAKYDTDEQYRVFFHNYCPYCGARMESGEE